MLLNCRGWGVLVDPGGFLFPRVHMMETAGSPPLVQSRSKFLPLPLTGCLANLTSLSILLQLVAGELTGIPILQTSCRILLPY